MARYYQIDQRSREWFAAKLGKPSASNAHKLVTPKGKLSTQAEGYMHTLIAELMLGHPIETPETQWMIRGTELEEAAMRAYEFQSGNETMDGGWVTTDDGRYGCSPDRLIGDNEYAMFRQFADELSCVRASLFDGDIERRAHLLFQNAGERGDAIGGFPDDRTGRLSCGLSAAKAQNL